MPRRHAARAGVVHAAAGGVWEVSLCAGAREGRPRPLARPPPLLPRPQQQVLLPGVPGNTHQDPQRVQLAHLPGRVPAQLVADPPLRRGPADVLEDVEGFAVILLLDKVVCYIRELRACNPSCYIIGATRVENVNESSDEMKLL